MHSVNVLRERLHLQSCCTSIVGVGDSGEELDVSLLRITLFHEHWQGLLHELDLATLRANSAVSMTPHKDSSSATTAVSHQSALQASEEAAALPFSSSLATASSSTSSASPTSDHRAEPGAATSSTQNAEVQSISSRPASSAADARQDNQASTSGRQVTYTSVVNNSTH